MKNELCVNCNKETPYSIDTHIDERQHYVEGGGQLCSKCWNKIYVIQNNKEQKNGQKEN